MTRAEMLVYKRLWRANNPEKVRAHKRKNYAKYHEKHKASHREWLARNYERVEAQKELFIQRKRFKTCGVTDEQYQKLYQDQGGCCAICHRHRSTQLRELAIDHDHVTGKSRGLLCNTCNMGLGLLRDNTEILGNAIKYLEQYRGVK